MKTLITILASVAALGAAEITNTNVVLIRFSGTNALTDSGIWRTSTNILGFTNGKGETILSIALDGRMTMGHGMTQDRASRVFWTNIANAYPFVKRHLVTQELGVEKAELVAVLKEVSQHLQPSTNQPAMMLNAVHITPPTPAEALREKAAEMERRDAVIARFRGLLRRLEERR